MRILNRDILTSVRIPAIRVTSNVNASTQASDIDAVENHVRRISNEVIVSGTESQIQVADRGIVQSDDSHEGWPQNEVVLSEQVVPNLTVSIYCSSTIQLDVVATKLKEGSGVLEDLSEGIGLPVDGIIGEFYIALDVNVNAVQEGEIQSRSDRVVGASCEYHMTPVIASSDGAENEV